MNWEGLMKKGSEKAQDIPFSEKVKIVREVEDIQIMKDAKKGVNVTKMENKKEDEFKFEEESASPKIVFTVYGKKGDGKTVLAFSLPGTKGCLSFDHKSIFVKKYYYNGEESIKVYDAVKYWKKDYDNILESAEKSVEYIMWLLDELKSMKMDWIIIDGLEIYEQICEMYMRAKEGLKPYQGVPNMNVWKIRKALMDSIHKKAVDCCKKGVVYTTYSKKDEIIEEGNFVKKSDVPNYIDVIAYETDIVIHAFTKENNEGIKRYLYKVISSKNDNIIKSGAVVDWTGKGCELNLK